MIGCICFILLAIIEWLLTVTLVKVITLCFGWTFSWLIATGIWLILVLLSAFFKK